MWLKAGLDRCIKGDENMSAISDTIQEVKDTKSFSETDKTTALIPRAIRAALSPLEKWILQKEYNLAETEKLLASKLNNVPVGNIITPPSYVAVPALQAIAYCMDDEQLREMYAELLTHAMNSETVDNVHPTFVEIIKQMSPYDAIVFRKLVSQLVIPCVGIKYGNKQTKASYPIQDIVAFGNLEKHPVVPTQISLENLERLRLIEIRHNQKSNNNEPYELLKRSVAPIVEQFIKDNEKTLDKNIYEVQFDDFVIVIRGFGQFFARACFGEDFSEFI